MKYVGLKVCDEIAKRIRKLAGKDSRTMSGWLRKIIMEELDKQIEIAAREDKEADLAKKI